MLTVNFKNLQEGEIKFEAVVKTLRETLVNYITYNITDNEYESAIYNTNSSVFSFNPESAYLLTNSTNDEDKFLILDKYLDQFIKSVLEVESQNLYSGQDCVEGSRWGFYSALLFTMSIMSSVGYGNVWPVTWVFLF